MAIVEKLIYATDEDSYNGVYRMSSAGNCKKAIGLWRLGGKPRPFSQRELAIMREGRLQESLLIAEMESNGIEITDRQRECWTITSTLSLLGHLDGKIQVDGALGILEIKAPGLSAFLRLQEERLSAFPNYMVQCALYMEAEKAPFCLLVAKCRDNAEKLEILLEPIPTLAAKILEKLGEIEFLAGEDQVFQARYDIASPECRFCHWKHYCISEPFVDEISSPDLLEAAENYRVGHSLRIRAEVLEESAKAQFKAYLKNAQLSRMQVANLIVSLAQRIRTSIDRELLEQLSPHVVPLVTKATSYDVLSVEEQK